MPALANFLRNELHRRDWSIEDFVRRADLSVSAGYLIIQAGKDNVRQDTFDNIAAALSMTPAELMIAIGKGTKDHDPERVPLHVLIDQAPSENLSIIDRVVRAFVPTTHATGTRRRNAQALHPKLNASSNPDDSDADNTPNVRLRGLQGLLALAVANS